MPAPDIGPARPDEVADAVRVVTDAFSVMRPALAPEQWDALAANIAAGLGDTAGNTVLVARVDGRVVGAVCYSGPAAPRRAFPDGWAYFRALGVAPDQGGVGLGQALVARCIALARRDGASHLGLYTADMNMAARRLYARMGFAMAPEPKVLYGVPYHVHAIALGPGG